MEYNLQVITEEDFLPTATITPIIEGITLVTYESEKEAVLRLGGTDIEFKWTDEARELFENIDTAEVIEVLELMYRLRL